MALDLKKLREANAQRGIEWAGQANSIDDLPFTTIELGGEVGELTEAVHDWLLAGIRLPAYITQAERPKCIIEDLSEGQRAIMQSVLDELADVVISLDRVAESLGIPLQQLSTDPEFDFKVEYPDGGLCNLILRIVTHAGRLQDHIKKVMRAKKGYRGGIPLDEAKETLQKDCNLLYIGLVRLANIICADMTELVTNKFNATSNKHGLKTKLSN
ncbi:hypothetical protein [Neptuniibacter sp. QD37_11]|uniref:hypothetical protein n=1 Tax=Neptuniibacter sp. QD37_11 TaxID=3398209 RepID=UPI0039F4FEEB